MWGDAKKIFLGGVVQTRPKPILLLSSGQATGADAIPAEVNKHDKAGGLPMAEKTDRSVSMQTEKGGYPIRLQRCFHDPSIHVNGKEILKSVTTTEVSLSYQLLERYCQKFYQTA